MERAIEAVKWATEVKDMDDVTLEAAVLDFRILSAEQQELAYCYLLGVNHGLQDALGVRHGER